MQKTCNRHARTFNVNYIIGEAESRRGDEMEKIKCWMCGKEIDMPYTAKELEVLEDPFSTDDEIFSILDKREMSAKRVYCPECNETHKEHYEMTVKEYCKLRNEIMFERALKIFEKQDLNIYDYRDASIAVKQYMQDSYESCNGTEYVAFDSADEVATAIVFVANEIKIKVHAKIAKHEVDFVIPSMKVVLEIDGELFHKGKEKKESRRDSEIRQLLGKEWEIIRVPTKYIHRNIELLPENVRSLKEERQKVRKVTGGYIPDTYSRHKS